MNVFTNQVQLHTYVLLKNSLAERITFLSRNLSKLAINFIVNTGVKNRLKSWLGHKYVPHLME